MRLWLSLWSLGPDPKRGDIETIKRFGFEGIEIWAENPRAREHIKMAVEAGLQIGLHLPFHDLNLATNDPIVSEHAVKVLTGWLNYLSEYRPQHAVMHGGCAWSIEERWNAVRQAKKTIGQLNNIATNLNVKLLLENLAPDGTGFTHPIASTMAEWVELLSDEDMDACLDTGHLALMGSDSEAAISTLGNRLASIHYSDNDRRADLHLLPGDGQGVTEGLLDILDSTGFKGTLVYEINPYRYSIDDILTNIKGAMV